MRVADQLEQRPQPEGQLAVDADGRDLDPPGGVPMVVAVDLRQEPERPARDLADTRLVRVVDLARAVGGDLLRGRAAGGALRGAIDLLTPAGALASVRLDREARRDHDAETRAAAEVGGDIGGAHAPGAVRRRDHQPPSAGPGADPPPPRPRGEDDRPGGPPPPAEGARPPPKQTPRPRRC